MRAGAKHRFLVLLGGVSALLLLAAVYLWFLGGTNPATAQAIGGPFQLQSSDGRTVTDRSFRGRYLLIYFGYTTCQDVCPTTLATVARALDLLGPRAAQLQPLFVTVDPQRDTPDVLRGYVAGFTPRLIGLTGTTQQVRAVERAYRVSSVPNPRGIDHSSVLLLVGPDGTYRAAIPADATGAEMAAAIAAYLG